MARIPILDRETVKRRQARRKMKNGWYNWFIDRGRLPNAARGKVSTRTIKRELRMLSWRH